MITKDQLKQLMIHAANRTAPENFELSQVNQAIKDAWNEYIPGGSIAGFMKGRYDLYEVITAVVDEVAPKRIQNALSLFVDYESLPQGAKKEYRTKGGKHRAKQFITRVGLSGVYEAFRLDSNTFEVAMDAIGGAGTIDFERLLDGAESVSEIIEVFQEGQLDAVFRMVSQALQAAADTSLNTAAATNIVVSNTFEADKMVKLVNVAKAYGNPVIFASPEFIAEMGPDAIVPGSENYQGVYHPDDIDDIHKLGRITMFRGTPVVELPQSFVDETNTTTLVNPQFAYVLPTGQDKPIKLVTEGATQMWDLNNADQSMEIHFYKKMGVALVAYNNWGIYQNTGIEDTSV